MASVITVDQILVLARQLSREDKLQLINELNPDASCAPAVAIDPASAAKSLTVDDQYERGYRLIPEDTADIEALLPHLPLPAEQWE